MIKTWIQCTLFSCFIKEGVLILFKLQNKLEKINLNIKKMTSMIYGKNVCNSMSIQTSMHFCLIKPDNEIDTSSMTDSIQEKKK